MLHYENKIEKALIGQKKSRPRDWHHEKAAHEKQLNIF